MTDKPTIAECIAWLDEFLKATPDFIPKGDEQGEVIFDGILMAIRAQLIAAQEMSPQKFMDEIDAWQTADAWIEKSGLEFDQIETYGLRLEFETAKPSGGVIVYSNKGHVIATITVVRDSMNWSVLTISPRREAGGQ